MYLNYLLRKRILKKLFLIFFLTGIILSLNNKKVYAFPFPAECSKKLNAIKNYDKNIEGVVVVSTSNTSGSGFVIGQKKNKTYILTNLHVIEGKQKVAIKWSNGFEDTGYVIADAGGESNLTDLAIIEIDGISGKLLKLNKKPPKVGSEVIAIGSPEGCDFTLTKGAVSQLRDQEKIIQFDAALNFGNSGGPLIDNSGCVVGINTLKYTNAEGLSFAISSEVIQRFIDKKKYLFGQKNNPSKYEISYKIKNPKLSKDSDTEPPKNKFKNKRAESIFKPPGIDWYLASQICLDKPSPYKCEPGTLVKSQWNWFRFLERSYLEESIDVIPIEFVTTNSNFHSMSDFEVEAEIKESAIYYTFDCPTNNFHLSRTRGVYREYWDSFTKYSDTYYLANQVCKNYSF